MMVSESQVGLKLQSVEMLMGTLQHKNSIFSKFLKIKYMSFLQASSDPLLPCIGNLEE